MAEAIAVQIANAVVAELNDTARNWSVPFEAEKKWRPVWNDDELNDLRVAVVPLTLAETKVSRKQRQSDYGIAIDLQRHLDAETLDADADLLAKTAEEVQEWFTDENGHELAGMAGWRVMEATQEDIYDLARLYEHFVFETLIVLTVRGFRQ